METHVVIVELQGGLGNQMFLYAVARALSVHHGVPLKLDVTSYRDDKLRKYKLHQFRVIEEFATPEETAKFRPSRGQFLKWTVGQIRNRMFPYRFRNVVWERSKRFDGRVFQTGSDVFVAGWWQSEKYFSAIQDLIRSEFSFKYPPLGANAEMLDRIKKTTSVSLHVRRGDYVEDNAISARFGTPSLAYYARAVARICGAIANPHLYVFSDDPAWAKQNLSFGVPTCFVSHNGPENDSEDLRLMSSCKHHITANSSFSWWGAWLGLEPGKIVIVPDPWLQTPNGIPAT